MVNVTCCAAVCPPIWWKFPPTIKVKSTISSLNQTIVSIADVDVFSNRKVSVCCVIPIGYLYRRRLHVGNCSLQCALRQLHDLNSAICFLLEFIDSVTRFGSLIAIVFFSFFNPSLTCLTDHRSQSGQTALKFDKFDIFLWSWSYTLYLTCQTVISSYKVAFWTNKYFLRFLKIIFRSWFVCFRVFVFVFIGQSPKRPLIAHTKHCTCTCTPKRWQA